MPSKTILTITGPEQSRDDLRLAAQLCEEIGGHLSVIVTSFAAPPQIGEYAAMVSDAWLQEREGDLARLAARTKEVAALLAEAPVSVDISSAYPELRWGDDVIGRRARYADVTLLGPELLASETLREKSIEGTLFSSGRPLLLVPFGASPTMKPNCVMVGWDSCSGVVTRGSRGTRSDRRRRRDAHRVGGSNQGGTVPWRRAGGRPRCLPDLTWGQCNCGKSAERKPLGNRGSEGPRDRHLC